LPDVIPQHPAQLGHNPRQRVVGDGSVGPQGVKNFLLREYMTRPLNHQREQVERFWFEHQGRPRPFEPIAIQVQDEVTPSISRRH